MNELQEIQKWFKSQCDGDWEHSFGVLIETLDNPGWSISIDLQDSSLANNPFYPVIRGDSDSHEDWIHCKVQDGKFQAAGGPQNLTELLQVFLRWASANAA